MLIDWFVSSCYCYLFGSETKLVLLVIFISPSSDGLWWAPGNSWHSGCHTMHFILNFCVLLIAQRAALPKNSCWCLLSQGSGKQFGKPEYGERTSPYNLQCNPQIFTILSENGFDVTDVSLPWLSIFLSSLQIQHPGLILPKPFLIYSGGLDFFEECISI